jgi:hypothetical protein
MVGEKNGERAEVLFEQWKGKPGEHAGSAAFFL